MLVTLHPPRRDNAAYQEVLVHGYLFQILERTHVVVALAATSTLFAVLHWGAYQGEWLAAGNIFLAGTAMGLMYWRSRSLWTPIACHFLWNFLLGPVLGLTVSGTSELRLHSGIIRIDGPGWLVGGPFGLEGGAAVTFTTGALIAVLALRMRDKSEDN